MEEDPKVLICALASETVKIPNSREGACSNCGEKVIRAPSSDRVVEAGIVVLCVQCSYVAVLGGTDEFRVLPGALEELRELGPDAVDQTNRLVKHLNAIKDSWTN